MQSSLIFFFNDTATTEIYTLSLHDALPIYHRGEDAPGAPREEIQIEAEEPLARSNARALLHVQLEALPPEFHAIDADRKSTRLNSSHSQISYAVFCLKKKKRITTNLYYLNG